MWLRSLYNNSGKGWKHKLKFNTVHLSRSLSQSSCGLVAGWIRWSQLEGWDPTAVQETPQLWVVEKNSELVLGNYGFTPCICYFLETFEMIRNLTEPQCTPCGVDLFPAPHTVLVIETQSNSVVFHGIEWSHIQGLVVWFVSHSALFLQANAQTPTFISTL